MGSRATARTQEKKLEDCRTVQTERLACGADCVVCSERRQQRAWGCKARLGAAALHQHVRHRVVVWLRQQ
jgi:hypothetical protein